MYRWCSFCQHLIGEVEPLADYRVTHGICDQCAGELERGNYSPEASVLRAKEIFHALGEAARSGEFEACDRAIDEALEAGLRNSEIMIGILHPALGQIGQRWEAGEISVAEEHRFTRFAEHVIRRLRHRRPARMRPLVLLAPFEENCHELGLTIMQHLAWERSVPCRRLPAGTTNQEIMMHALEPGPELVGLSVSLVETVPPALHFARKLVNRLPPESELVLGGQAFRNRETLSLPADLTVLQTIDQYLERVDRLADPGDRPDDARGASS